MQMRWGARGTGVEQSLNAGSARLKGLTDRDLRRWISSRPSLKIPSSPGTLSRSRRYAVSALTPMDFPAHLLPDSVLLAPAASDKWKLLESMVQAVARSWEMSPEIAAACHQCVFAREESASTGMEAGIAVPHAAVEGLEQLVIGMALLPDGLEFHSLDGKPAKVIVLILVPKKEKLIHLQTLTEVARRLSGEDFRESLLGAGSSAEVIQMWS